MGHFISSNAWFRRSNALLAGHLHSQKAMHFSSKPIDKGKGWSYLFFSCWINLRLRPLLNLYSTPEIWRGFQVNWCHTTSQDQHYSIWECLMETSMWRLSFLSSYQQVLIKYLLCSKNCWRRFGRHKWCGHCFWTIIWPSPYPNFGLK